MWAILDEFLKKLKVAPLGTQIMHHPGGMVILPPSGPPIYSADLTSAPFVELGLFLGGVAAIANERGFEIL